jgi:hypothetical protein
MDMMMRRLRRCYNMPVSEMCGHKAKASEGEG